ncbi:hypothetical protein FEQ05_06598 [Burkholderia pseudomultivorans]|uniref:Uncharacterized protein n=1 Tax=Burkholderia pseudomultivorans TaxID=1207504 RepID=A0ABU2E2Y2_9BURK|nr:hypothetical protein [Burkholderia pseudomultivorans]MDR8736768.1 hypothetical protein [Burkholderia pseudomultivorans]MDR8742613.1 hypothetical protein [Burkholderia pseudomultivorans]MDR8754221.1 hypothetical protein [Burkholderia pseudomultivorans]MDR8779483.1 hypothetical protein [Burkholderia pseudomultivorans]
MEDGCGYAPAGAGRPRQIKSPPDEPGGLHVAHAMQRAARRRFIAPEPPLHTAAGLRPAARPTTGRLRTAGAP